MGYELKRVPLDFSAPIGVVWRGGENPWYTRRHARSCSHCGGNGYGPEARRLMDKWYGHEPFRPEERGSKPWQPTDEPVMLAARRNQNAAPHFYGAGEDALMREATRLAKHFNRGWSHHLNQDDVDALIAKGRLFDLTHRFVRGEGWVKIEPAVRPTAAEVNAWSLNGMGHDGINQCVCVRARLRQMGKRLTCSRCAGRGTIWRSARVRAKADGWEEPKLPEGPGFQLWENVTEGSPLSPVFASAQELAKWMANSPDFGKGMDEGRWLKFVQDGGWAPTLVITSGEVVSGVEALTS
ncbi:hypothetical protein D3C71_20830 [compost metagenome]